jgi:site-specific DNA-methyltransferase (adenine-specific)
MQRIEKIGNITFILGDCNEFLKATPPGAFDLAIVDPPYGLNINSNIGRRKNDIKKHKKQTWDKSPPKEDYFIELKRVSNYQVIWGANNFKYLCPSNGWVVWDKDITGAVDFSEAELAYTNIKKTTKIFKYRAQSNENYSIKIHPTQKPIQLYKWTLINYAKKGDKILDTHGGSCSIAIACYLLGFELTIIEKDEDYFNAMLKRFKLETAQKMLF